MATNGSYVFASESVSEGHPDEVCDYIAGSILDAQLSANPRSRVACEVMAKSNLVILAGEITSEACLDYASLVRQAVREVGYTDPSELFCADTLFVQQLITRQSADIARGIDRQEDQGAGDQGIVFGYATDETPEMMPMPILGDSYGGAVRHVGGAFSGKVPSKVDRSAAYFCRYVARQVVRQGLARRAEIQVSYAIEVAQPVSIKVDTFGTGDSRAAEAFVRQVDFRPAAILGRLGLLRPIYRQTTNYGHFGKPELPWERDDR